jgi:hypothetical protein
LADKVGKAAEATFMNRVRCIWIALVLLPWVGGCGPKSLESKVSGHVTLDGKPIGPGTINFVREGGGQNPAIGNVDRDGNYTVVTNRTTGLLSGKYKVSVGIHQQPVNLAPGAFSPPMPLVHPEKYGSTETSGLEYNVETGINTINIELVSK